MEKFLLNNWSTILTSIFTAISLYIMIKQLRKEKSEAKKLESEAEKIAGADTSKTYAEAAELAAKQNQLLYTRLDNMERQIGELKNVSIDKDIQIVKLQDEIQDKDDQIKELQAKLIRCEKRILELEGEVELLRKK